jgi:hypothetical protein
MTSVVIQPCVSSSAVSRRVLVRIITQIEMPTTGTGTRYDLISRLPFRTDNVTHKA